MEHFLASRSKADLICYGAIVVELKALGELTGKPEAQLLNYHKATGLQRMLLLTWAPRDWDPSEWCERVDPSNRDRPGIPSALMRGYLRTNPSIHQPVGYCFTSLMRCSGRPCASTAMRK